MFLESELTGKRHDHTANLRAKHSGMAKEGRTYAIDATSVPMLPGTSPRPRQQPLQCHTIKTRRCKQKGNFLIIETDAFKPPFLLTAKSILVCDGLQTQKSAMSHPEPFGYLLLRAIMVVREKHHRTTGTCSNLPISIRRRKRRVAQ